MKINSLNLNTNSKTSFGAIRGYERYVKAFKSGAYRPGAETADTNGRITKATVDAANLGFDIHCESNKITLKPQENAEIPEILFLRDFDATISKNGETFSYEAETPQELFKALRDFLDYNLREIREKCGQIHD